MTAENSPRSTARAGTARRLLLTAGALGFTAAMAATILTPLVLSRFYTSDEDYSRASDIGQAYGAASAVVSILALAGVLAGLTMQYRQYTVARLQKLEQSTEELVQLAMDEPFYQQCWGARVAPEGMDERLILYCHRVLKGWKNAWLIDDLPEEKVRDYLASFFDSEVPRIFWKMRGDFIMQTNSGKRQEYFRVMVIEEYLRAERAGPPSRTYEPPRPAKNAPRSRRTSMAELNHHNGSRPTLS